ncbi:MAG TPA: response regulator transcription factor [Acidimicrobiales bacterium]|nr:response regulator transcription factor [Acidimicrobiales bacterium]
MDRTGPPAAVVVDEWPLVRLGVVQVLRSLDIAVAAEVATAEDGVRAAGNGGARFFLLGACRDLALSDAARQVKSLAAPPRVLVLVDHIGRGELGALRAVGIDALLPRSAAPAELADALRRVAAGERVVAPALLSLLMGVIAPAEPGPAAAGQAAGHREALTRKELQVLARLAEGRSNREIADALFVTPATVKSHLAHIYVKLGVTGRQEAMARAVALGLLG